PTAGAPRARAGGRRRAPRRGAEGGEVVLAPDGAGGPRHRLRVEGKLDVPGVAPQERIGRGAEIVDVSASPVAPPTTSHGGLARLDPAPRRLQQCVERPLQARRSHDGRRGEAGHLPERMHPRVGAAPPPPTPPPPPPPPPAPASS